MNPEWFWDDLGLQPTFIPNTVLGKWPRPWHNHPPEGTWRLFMTSSNSREGIQECTVKDVIDVLRNMVDTGQLQPDDVIRDVVLIRNRWVIRGWRHA